MLVHLIDSRCEKKAKSTVITSNRQPSKWQDFFSADNTGLGALDRLCEKALLVNINGASYRGKDLDLIKVKINNDTTR